MDMINNLVEGEDTVVSVEAYDVRNPTENRFFTFAGLQNNNYEW